MPLFTRENAAILGKKGAIARWSPKPAPAEPPEAPPATAPMAEADAYAVSALTRTRHQLDLVSALILADLSGPASKLDSRKLRDLADAQDRLAEQERRLAGRPMPGSLKHTQSRKAQAPAYTPTAPVIAPAPAPAAPPAKPAPPAPSPADLDNGAGI